MKDYKRYVLIVVDMATEPATVLEKLDLMKANLKATHRNTTNYKGCFQSSEGIGTSAAHAEVKGSRWLDIVTMFLVANWMVRGFAPLILLEDLCLSPFQALVNIGSFLYTYHEALRLPK